MKAFGPQNMNSTKASRGFDGYLTLFGDSFDLALYV